MSTSHTHARPKGQHGASYHRGEEKPTKPHSQLPTSCGAGGSWVFTGPGQIDPSTSPVPRPAPAGPRRNHRIRKSLRCQTRSEPRRPRSISAPVSSTLPDSSLRSIDVRVPQASTPHCLQWYLADPHRTRALGVASSLLGFPGPTPAPACGRTKRASLPAGTKRAGAPEAPTWVQSACRVAGARLAGAHWSAPRPQPGREGWLRAVTGGGGGGGAHGRRALSQGASGAGGARGRRPRGAWRLRAGASGGTAAPRKEDNSLPLPQAAGSRGRPGTIWSSRAPRGLGRGARHPLPARRHGNRGPSRFLLWFPGRGSLTFPGANSGRPLLCRLPTPHGLPRGCPA